MSRLPKIPVSNSSSNLPAPRRRSSVGNQGKPNLSLLTPEQEVLLAQVMERYGSRSNNSNEHHNASSTSPPLTTTTSSSISPPPVSSNQQQQNTTTLRKPGARRQSVSRNTRPTLPPLAELPTSNNTTTSIAPPKQSASKILSPPSSNNNSSSLATPNQPRRSPSNQNLQSGGGLKPSPAQQRLRVASTPQRPESPSLSLYSVGERVSVESMNIIGTLKYLGPLDIKPGTWAGIELDLPGTGKNDGNVNGKSYFTCKPKSGIFVLASKLSKETSSDQDSSDQSLPPPQRQKQKLPSSAKSLQRPSQIGLNNTATPSDNIQSSSNMTKNAQNAAIAASRITAGSRASKYIEITQSSTTSNDSPYSKSKQSILKRPGSIGNLKSNSSIQSSSISSPSSNNNALPNTRRRSNSSSSSGSAVSNKSQPTSSYHYSSRISANNKHRSPSPNHATDSQTTSDTESLGHATNNEEMSNKILQEKIQKLLNDQDTSESAHHINSNQTDVSMTANKENKEKWEAEKKVLLDEKENREKTLNRKIEDLNKQLQDSAKGHHFRPSTSLSMIADDDVMSDKILQLTELVEQKDEQVKELEDALGKANKQSDEYQSKIQHLEKINSEQTDKIEQLLVQISPNAQSELTDKIEQLEKTIQSKSDEIEQLKSQLESQKTDYESKIESMQGLINELKTAGQETINIYEQKITGLEHQVEDLKKAGIETIALYEETTTKINEKEAKINSLEKEAEELRSAGVEAIDVYEKTIEDTKKEVEEFRIQLTKKEESLSLANKEIEKYKVMQKELNDAKVKLELNEKREEGLRNELVDMQSGLEHMMRADAKSRERIYQLDDDIRESQALVTRQQEEIAALKSNVENLMTANNSEEVEKIKSVFESDAERYQEEIENLRKSLSDLQAEKRAVINEVDNSKDEMKLLERKIQDNERQKKDLIAELDTLKLGLQQGENERDQLAKEIEGLKANLTESVESNTKLLRDSESEKSALIGERDKVKTEVEELNQQLEEVIKKAELADKLKSDLEVKIKELDQLNESYEQFKKDHIKELKEIETQTIQSTPKEVENKLAANEEQMAGLKHIVQELTRENVKIAGENKKILAEQEKLMEAHKQVENECFKLMDELERLHSESLGGQGILTLTSQEEYKTISTSTNGHPAGADLLRLQSLLSEKQVQLDRLTSMHNAEIRELRQKVAELEKAKQKEVSSLNKDVAELESLVESKIFREADLEEEIQREKRTMKLLKDEVDDLKEQLKELRTNGGGLVDLNELVSENGVMNSSRLSISTTTSSTPVTKENGGSTLYCEICEEEGHDIISCKAVFGSQSELTIDPDETFGIVQDKAYCDNCEEYGIHWTEECPNQDETF
ncbi:7409_t:CDS:2 [Entrophospora sp. SA101]|nr:5521_t:CDS:2 [Entrophospora sp. SA101]CAJ0825903.1 15531_t:CDS:2 [Entrophospora sp. SA101]CAJ0859898.1 7409_t:CDS:2 [Entrophospora sp. SA101]